ncbi:hypothetical protein LOZ66_006359 [Ophidiomyces ophidiicola]|nr:hypothetical protein LOZ66_006359 [Ophidiomyces ophidiicola]
MKLDARKNPHTSSHLPASPARTDLAIGFQNTDIIKELHIISDHLNIFMDTKSTLEDILAKKGQSLKKVTLGEGDTELWPQQPSDGAETDSLKPLEDTKDG